MWHFHFLVFLGLASRGVYIKYVHYPHVVDFFPMSDMFSYPTKRKNIGNEQKKPSKLETLNGRKNRIGYYIEPMRHKK